MRYATALLLIGSQVRADHFILNSFLVMVYGNRMASRGVVLGYEYDKAYRRRFYGCLSEANGALTPPDLFRRDRYPSLLSSIVAAGLSVDTDEKSTKYSVLQKSRPHRRRNQGPNANVVIVGENLF